jgi:hypothetical protein
VFLGITGNDAPAIEKTFDRRVRDALSVSPECRVWDYLESQDFRRRIAFDDYSTVSRRLVESLRQFSNDSAIFVWATVRNFTMKPVRQWVVKSAVEADLTLTLSVYSLRFRDYTFIGDVHSTYLKPKEYIFFYPVERGTHISALDRSEITGKLIDAAAYQAADMITAVVRSEKAKALKGVDTTNISKRREPSISDMFSVPSVEPAAIERGRKKVITPEEQPVAPAAAAKPAPAPAASPKDAAAEKPKTPADTVKVK